jgi:hypothetical protein
MTELGLDVEGLTETVLHLNLGYFLFVCFPFDETTTELLPKSREIYAHTGARGLQDTKQT